ncbi:MAG: hypothetical protein COA69_01020 [Robiginitomaculum sp.]|nr:MAG: hypothetical protein COA69_01020 [Robiginitomaculum sp.]
MKKKDPDWYSEGRAHNSLMQLKLALWTQPLFMFGVVYYLVDFFEVSDKKDIRILCGLGVAGLTWVVLNWVIKKLEAPHDDKTIG